MTYASEEIIAALKKARDAKGLSQRDLSARTGVPQSHISKIESGSADIRLSSLTELARALDLEVKLVPRKALPAVESLVRSTAPAATIKELQRALSTVDRLRLAYPELSTLNRLQENLRTISNFRAIDKYLDSDQVRDPAARRPAKTGRATTTKPQTCRPRPSNKSKTPQGTCKRSETGSSTRSRRRSRAPPTGSMTMMMTIIISIRSLAMADVSVLNVKLYGATIGTLTHVQGDRTLFSFTEDYVADQNRPTLGLSFKDDLGGLITDQPATQVRVLPFFSNLLPEGPSARLSRAARRREPAKRILPALGAGPRPARRADHRAGRRRSLAARHG